MSMDSWSTCLYFQGFLKVHTSLTALITHHSIMPELLPVTLNIHRHNPSFSGTSCCYNQTLTDIWKAPSMTPLKGVNNPFTKRIFQWSAEMAPKQFVPKLFAFHKLCPLYIFEFLRVYKNETNGQGHDRQTELTQIVDSHRQCLVTAGCSDLDHDYASLQDFTQLMRDMKIAGAGQGAGQYDLLEEQQENAYQWTFRFRCLSNLIKTFLKSEEVLFKG